MTQSIVHSSIHAVLRLGHLIKKHGLTVTQMTQLCKIRIVAIYLQLGVDSVKQSLTIATLGQQNPVNNQLI